MNRSERRIFTQVRECFPRKRQCVLREAIHTLAQQGIIEYEAAQAFHAKSTVNVWLAQESVYSERDSLYREILTLRAELDRVHDERSSDNHSNCKKEIPMATITLDMESMCVDTLGAKMQGVVIRAEVPDSDLPAFFTLVSKLPTNKEPHVCKCEASNGDKRPGTAATYSSRGKQSGNAFAPDLD